MKKGPPQGPCPLPPTAAHKAQHTSPRGQRAGWLVYTYFSHGSICSEPPPSGQIPEPGLHTASSSPALLGT